MSLEFVRKLPTPTEIREQYPLSARATEIKKQRDAEIAKVFTGDSDKFLVIVGPCSADNEDAVLEYNHRLAKVADKVSDKLIIIRVSIPTNRVPQVKATKVSFISRTRKESRTCCTA